LPEYLKKNLDIFSFQIFLYDKDTIKVIDKEEKQAFTRNVIIMGVCLLIYWIILLLVYEKDKKYMVENIDEDYLFEKYNAIMAGCIQGSRNILARDIIAEILNLIDKGNIKLEIKNKLTGGKYLYEIEKVPEKEHEMDSIQKYVYDWVFDTKQTEELADRLKEMPKFTEANKKFKGRRNQGGIVCGGYAE